MAPVLEARAVTNFSGNAVATILVGTWTGTVDRERAAQVLDGRAPFDEATMLDEHEAGDRGHRSAAETAPEPERVRS